MKTLASKMRLPALGLIIAVALFGSQVMLSPAAHAAPAQAARAATVGCTGWGCNGQDAIHNGCYASAWVVETYYYAHGWVKVWYSSGCNSNWYEIGAYSGYMVAGYGLGSNIATPPYEDYVCEGVAAENDEPAYCIPNWTTSNYWKANDIPNNVTDWIGNMVDGQYVVCGAAHIYTGSGNTDIQMSAGCH